MASDISFGSLLKNPLVLGVLATEMTGNLAKSYTEAENQSRAEEALQTEKLKTMAAATGQVQTEVPREGLFGKIGAGLGIISPTTPAKPYQIAEEGLAIQGQQSALQGAVEKEIGLRKTLGPEGWEKHLSQLREGNAFQKLLAGQLTDIPMTPLEKKQSEGTPAFEYAQTPGLQDKVTTKKSGQEADPGYGFRVPREPKDTPEVIEEKARRRTLGVKKGTIESDIATSPLPFYDPVTMYPIRGKMSIEDAKNKGYIVLNANGQMAAAGLHAGDKEIDRLEKLADKWLVPTTKNLSVGSWASTIGQQWIKVQAAAKRGDAEAISLINASTLEGIKVIHDVQKRYPSQIELKTIEPMLPNGSRMAADDFRDNLENLRNYLHQGVGMGVREDSGKIETDDARAVADSIISGGD